MRLTKAGLVIMTGICVVLALLAAFAVELSNTQAKSKNDIKTQIHDRAVLAAALIDSLFGTAEQQTGMDTSLYGGPAVDEQTLQKNLANDVYLIVADSSGKVLASAGNVTTSPQAEFTSSSAVKLIGSGHPYGLGNFEAVGTTGVIDFAVAFPASDGSTRILLTGFTSSTLSGFIAGEMKTIPGVKGSVNYLVDGNDVVLASTQTTAIIGRVITQPGAVDALRNQAADTHGTFYSQVNLTNSTWRMVLTSPDGPLFASVTGLHQDLPWILFGAFALVAIGALLLGFRVIRASDELQTANGQLGRLNAELADVNSALERRAGELARSNEELDQFASIASHDLQEPLRKIRTFAEQLNVIESDRLSEKGKDYLVRANSAAERMQKLIEDLLKFSRVSTQARPFVPVDLSEVTHDVLSDLDAQVAEAAATVRVGELPTIEADPLQMQQLIQNLVSNSIKFRRDGVAPEVDIRATVSDGQLHLEVRDNGIGFEPRYSARIFRVFERLHGRGDYPGTGIGLALCRKIADRHGGTIVATGEPGTGSTFTVVIPTTQRHDEKMKASRDDLDMSDSHATV